MTETCIRLETFDVKARKAFCSLRESYRPGDALKLCIKDCLRKHISTDVCRNDPSILAEPHMEPLK